MQVVGTWSDGCVPMVDASLGLLLRFLRLALTALMSGDGLSLGFFNTLESEALQVILHVSSVMSFQCIAYLSCKAQTYAWCFAQCFTRVRVENCAHQGITWQYGIQDFPTCRTFWMKCTTCSDHSCGAPTASRIFHLITSVVLWGAQIELGLLLMLWNQRLCKWSCMWELCDEFSMHCMPSLQGSDLRMVCAQCFTLLRVKNCASGNNMKTWNPIYMYATYVYILDI